VPVPDPAHLLEQAERLAAAPARRRPRDADLRRAISTAYYGIFHAILTAAADLFVGAAKRTTSLYGLTYRSVNHQKVREVCKEVAKPTPSDRYKPYVPPAAGAILLFSQMPRSYCRQRDMRLITTPYS
jgi:hypothetical protein